MDSQANKNRSNEAEKEYLEHTLSFAGKELSRAKTSGDDIKSAIISAKKEMRESTTHTIGSLWGSEAFEALAALNQYANPINDQVIELEENENKILRLENILKSPYFARIDFLYADEPKDTLPQPMYIGRTSLKDNKSHHMYIYDWRSPIASVFYRFVTGEAYYDAPGGRTCGTLVFKRQFEIKNGVMEYYFDADVQIVDEFLRKLLAKNTSSHMKAIVETIQKEQDIVIRDMENDLMMVQGVAGSGKTSIALHRAAYLLYQGLSSHLLANNILIISPNTFFEQYISRVLPDLGEDNVASAVFEEIAGKVIGAKKIELRDEYLEKMLTAKTVPAACFLKERLELKTSLFFADIIDRFVAEIPNWFIEIPDIDYAGQSIISAKQIRRKLNSSALAHPLGVILKQIEEHIMETVYDVHRVHRNHAELKRIKNKLKGFSSLNAKKLYRFLFTDGYCLKNLLNQIPEEVIKITAANLNSKTIAYDDVAALLYLKLKLYGTEEYKAIRHALIDEAQDYYPLHYLIFGLLLKKAKYTILGDYNQTLLKEEDISLYERIAGILDKPKSVLVTMDKSFRSTNEILSFCAKFLAKETLIKSFNRQGEEPQVHIAPSKADLGKMLIIEAKRLSAAGYQSVALIVKTALNAKNLYQEMMKMGEEITINLIGYEIDKGISIDKKISIDKEISMDKEPSTDKELSGIFIIPVYLAKGLEFDAVLICDTDDEDYHGMDKKLSEEDKKFFYIAGTRALHHLGVFSLKPFL